MVRVLVREENDEITSGLMATGLMNDVVKQTLLIPSEYLNQWTNDIIKPLLNSSNDLLINDYSSLKEELELKSPYQYGIVVIDLKKMKLSSYQGFSGPKWIRIYELLEWIERSREKLIPLFHYSLEKSIIQKVRKSNKLKENDNSKLSFNVKDGAKTIGDSDSEFKRQRTILDSMEPVITRRVIDMSKIEKSDDNLKEENFFDISYFSGEEFYNFIVGCYQNHNLKNGIMKEIQEYFKEKNINIDLFDYMSSYIVFNSPFEIKFADLPDEKLKKELELDGFVFTDEENVVWKEYFLGK